MFSRNVMLAGDYLNVIFRMKNLTGSEMSSNPSIKAILGVPEDREVTTKVYSTISSNINNIYLVITTFDLMFWMIIDLKRYIDLR